MPAEVVRTGDRWRIIQVAAAMGTRVAITIGAIPIIVGLIYLGLQVAFGQQTEWSTTGGEMINEAGDFVGKVAVSI